MTTTTNPYPDVPLPPGALAISDWEDWGNYYRIVWTKDRKVSGYDVRGSAMATTRIPARQPCFSATLTGYSRGEPLRVRDEDR
jgi:hypothetical protein